MAKSIFDSTLRKYIKILESSSEYKINFANNNQVILYECELKGQLSDGHWENARPIDHWEIPCEAEARVGTPLGKNFNSRRKYNFADEDLIDVVGDRMIWFVKYYTAFPNVSMDDHWKMYHSYYVDKYINTPISDDIKEINNKVNAVQYTEDQLKKDLKEMNRIFNAPAIKIDNTEEKSKSDVDTTSIPNDKESNDISGDVTGDQLEFDFDNVKKSDSIAL